MAHLSSTLPKRVELGATRHTDWGTEVVKTDSGAEVRNNRWSEPLRAYDVSFPVSRRTDSDYVAVTSLFEDAQGSLHSFNFTDWADNATVAVRFDGPLTTTGITQDLEQIVQVTLVEVRLGAES